MDNIDEFIDLRKFQYHATPAALKLSQEFIDDILSEKIVLKASMLVYIGTDGAVYFRLSDNTEEEAAVTMCNTVNAVLGLQLSGDVG